MAEDDRYYTGMDLDDKYEQYAQEVSIHSAGSPSNDFV